MSYCRFSSDNFRSDVYCYEHCGGGFATHVAGLRHVGLITPLARFPTKRRSPLLGALAMRWFLFTYAAQSFCLRRLTRLRPIGGEHDGETFMDETLGDLRERLLSLRRAGYHVPESALRRIEDEAKAIATTTSLLEINHVH